MVLAVEDRAKLKDQGPDLYQVVSERQVDHREVCPVEDRSASQQGLADWFLLELFEGRATSWPDWHLGALRQQDRVGVKVEFSTTSPAATAISAKNSPASPICTRSPAATRIRPVFLPRHGFGRFSCRDTDSASFSCRDTISDRV